MQSQGEYTGTEKAARFTTYSKHPIQTMEIKQLRTFVAVYSSGSFTRAAERLSTSQPTISETIKQLENELDCKLFDRLGRSIRPTRKAEQLYPGALAVIEEIYKIKKELMLEDTTVSGELVIGASTIPGVFQVPRLANALKTKHEDVFFEVRIGSSGEIIDSVLNHELLLGVVGKKFESRNLRVEPFVEDELILIAAAGKDIDEPVSMDTLKIMPFLIREKGSGTRKTIEGYFAKQKLDINRMNITAVLGSNSAIVEGVKEDFGVSIVSRTAIYDELRNGLLQEIQIEEMTIKRMFYIISHKKRTLPNQYALFKKLLEGNTREI